MYENKYKNIKLTEFKDLNLFLLLIADLNEEIELFAIGGTAMIIKCIKEATKDIDFLTTAKYEDIKIIRMALVKTTCNSCSNHECEGCPLEPHKVTKSYFKDENEDYVDEAEVIPSVL